MNMISKMEKLEKNAVLKIDFFDKEYIVEWLNPSVVRITDGKSVRYLSVTGELFIEKKNKFYEKPYLIKFKTDFLLSPKSILKLFLKLPVVTTLVAQSKEKQIEIDKHIEYNKMAWHGEVHRGELCTYVDAEFTFEELIETRDAIVPIRIINRSDVSREISKIVIEPDNLILVKGDNGLFTNKVYIMAVSSNEFGVKYSSETVSKVVNPEIIIDRKISVAEMVLIKFEKFGIARELGL